MSAQAADSQGILRFAYLPPAGFVHPFVSRLHAARSATLRALLNRWEEDGIGDLAMSVSTKLSMLEFLAERLTGAITPLLDAIGQAGIEDHVARGAGFVFPDRIAPYRALLEVDGFIYEFRSFYEILGKFIVAVFSALGRPLNQKAIVEELTRAGIDMAWSAELQAHRKVFFHERAPWLAARVHAAEPLNLEFLVLLGPDSDPSSPDQAVSFTRLSAIYAGMSASLSHIQKWILSEFEAIDSV